MEQVKREFEHRWQELGSFVREQRRLGEMSLRKLSELSGISNPYLSQIERGLRRPSADILQQLARALEISAETLYVRAGILDAQDEPGDLVEAIRRAGELSEAQKRTLIHIYESFRAESGGGAAGGVTGVATAPVAPAAPASAAARPARQTRESAGGAEG